jgi:hypothetical protein
MGAAVNQHILQTVDWTRFDLEGWLYQFGAWQNTLKGTCGKPLNPIAAAMDQAVVKRKKLKLGIRKQRQIIADVMLGNVDFMPKKKQTPKDTVCQIDDNEARAVQRLILDMQGKSEILDDWLYAVIDRYFYFNSWSEMVTEERSQMDARMDVKCGLAALHVRYGFIGF